MNNKNTFRAEYRDHRIIMYQILKRLKKEGMMIFRNNNNSNNIDRTNRIGITKILFSCRISMQQFDEYMALILKTKLAERKKSVYQRQKGKTLYDYFVTEKGLKYIELVERMHKEFFENDTTHFLFPKNLDLD